MLFRDIQHWDLHERQFKILYELITTSEKYVTGKKLSMVTSLSLKTVKKEVELLNDQLIALDAIIVSSPGEGYRLISSNSFEYIDFEQSVLEFYNRGLFFQDEKDNRVHYIIRRLFAAKEMVFIDDLAHECHVSRSVISKDIRTAKEELKKFKLKIINLNGLHFNGQIN